MKLSYIADFSLPSNKAYSIHVFKMLDSFAKYGIFSELIIPYSKKNLKKKYIKNFYNLKNNKLIKLKTFFLYFKEMNFFWRIIFGFKVAKYLKDIKQDRVIITRSLLSSIFLTLFRKSHFLEIHQELKGISKLFLINFQFINSNYVIKVIFISKELSKFYKICKKSVVLHDAVDLEDFKKYKKKISNVKNITYTGSLYKGRGIQKIIKLALKLPKLNFRIYGKRNENIEPHSKNIKIFDFVKHSEVPKILNQSDLLIMPYSKKVSLNTHNLSQDISKFTSPLKMFEYLASGTPIISSNLKVLREILKNNHNAFLINDYEKIDHWEKKIKKIINNKKLLKRISINAKKTAINYTWDIRAKKYLLEYKNFKQI